MISDLLLNIHFRNTNRQQKNIMEAAKLDEEFAFDCANFATNISEISNSVYQQLIDLCPSSKQGIEAVTYFTNQGVEIEKLKICKLNNEACLANIPTSMVHFLESIKANSLCLELNIGTVWHYCYYQQHTIILVLKEQRKLDQHCKRIMHQLYQISVFYFALLLLFIAGNKIGHEGAKEIGFALQKNCKLTTLNLSMSFA
eukprot:TRINITY_DN911_c1_g1_i1.p2 TRINITY_DN911_c1_g1~~TRINITY_DN911_c1_g1_i1.p2  ORF type:complete len:200 (-),score=0.87 TRINITY_DN911_c1_g1_i1:51-650(-)